MCAVDRTDCRARGRLNGGILPNRTTLGIVHIPAGRLPLRPCGCRRGRSAIAWRRQAGLHDHRRIIRRLASRSVA